MRNLISKWEKGNVTYYLFQRDHYRYELERCINGCFLLIQYFEMALEQVNLRLMSTYRLVCVYPETSPEIERLNEFGQRI